MIDWGKVRFFAQLYPHSYLMWPLHYQLTWSLTILTLFKQVFMVTWCGSGSPLNVTFSTPCTTKSVCDKFMSSDICQTLHSQMQKMDRQFEAKYNDLCFCSMRMWCFQQIFLKKNTLDVPEMEVAPLQTQFRDILLRKTAFFWILSKLPPPNLDILYNFFPTLKFNICKTV